jgi:hypothetical protein
MPKSLINDEPLTTHGTPTGTSPCKRREEWAKVLAALAVTLSFVSAS